MARILGGNVDTGAGSDEFVSSGPSSNRTVLEGDIRQITRLLNFLKSNMGLVEAGVNGFDARFTNVVGNELGSDFSDLGGDLISVLKTMKEQLDSGSTGDSGSSGYKGWTAIPAIVEDGERRVYQVIDWIGGDGPKPETGLYVSITGFVTDISKATDIRGPAGATVGGETVPTPQFNWRGPFQIGNMYNTYDVVGPEPDGNDYIATMDGLVLPPPSMGWDLFLLGGQESDIAWLPSITPEGDISWERSSTTEPPETVNIKGPSGKDGEPGKTPTKGVDYFDGITPHIGENGNWWIGDIDTGTVSSTPGPKGTDGESGKNATINGVNVLELVEGDNVTLTQEDSKLIISAKGGVTGDLSIPLKQAGITKGSAKGLNFIGANIEVVDGQGNIRIALEDTPESDFLVGFVALAGWSDAAVIDIQGSHWLLLNGRAINVADYPELVGLAGVSVSSAGTNLIKPMTSNTAPAPQVASASSVTPGAYSYAEWRVFNGKAQAGQDYWISGANTHVASNGVVNNPGTHWIQIDMGNPIEFNGFGMSPAIVNRYLPYDFDIVGSNDGTTFESIAELRNVEWKSGSLKIGFTLGKWCFYRYIRFVPYRYSEGGYATLGKFELYNLNDAKLLLPAVTDPSGLNSYMMAGR